MAGVHYVRASAEVVGIGERSIQTWVADVQSFKLGDESKSDGAVAIGFGSDGSSDPAEIWLRDTAGYDVRIRLVAFTGEIQVEEIAHAQQ